MVRKHIKRVGCQLHSPVGQLFHESPSGHKYILNVKEGKTDLAASTPDNSTLNNKMLPHPLSVLSKKGTNSTLMQSVIPLLILDNLCSSQRRSLVKATHIASFSCPSVFLKATDIKEIQFSECSEHSHCNHCKSP